MRGRGRARIQFPRRRRVVFYEVYEVCGYCSNRHVVATFNHRREAVAWMRARPKRKHQILVLERSW